MSKMSQLHMELSEQAYELGFDSIKEAERMGFEVDLAKGKLIDPQEAAFRAMHREKMRVIMGLTAVRRNNNLKDIDKEEIDRAIEFITKEAWGK